MSDRIWDQLKRLMVAGNPDKPVPLPSFRIVEFPDGAKIIGFLASGDRLFVTTDAGVFEVIDGVAVLLKPELPA